MSIEKVIMHYLPGTHLKAVIESGYLDVTPAPENLARGEKPIAWFTTSEVYPPTAYKPVQLSDGTQHMLTPDDMHNILGGVFRLVGSSTRMECINWQILKHKANLPKKLRKGLVGYARKVGENPGDWYGSLERIDIGMLLLQKWNGKDWDTVPFKMESIGEIKATVERTTAHTKH